MSCMDTIPGKNVFSQVDLRPIWNKLVSLG
jgi:hypothetical protein